jgi:uncharacterized protein with ParB-like and HNH nuclease domain
LDTPAQKKKLIDSVLRGYPIPLIYLQHIRQAAGKLVSERYEVIDGQQRINALSDFFEGAFKLFDPDKDAAEARFPDFIKRQPCAWARQTFHELNDEIKKSFLDTALRIVRIETHNSNEARDLFVPPPIWNAAKLARKARCLAQAAYGFHTQAWR